MIQGLNIFFVVHPTYIIGMTSLFFMDLDKADRDRRKKELDTIFNTVVKQGRQLLKAENCRCALPLLCQNNIIRIYMWYEECEI